jgi:hypothetical protein
MGAVGLCPGGAPRGRRVAAWTTSGPGGRGAGGRRAGRSAASAGPGRSSPTWASRCCSPAPGWLCPRCTRRPASSPCRSRSWPGVQTRSGCGAGRTSCPARGWPGRAGCCAGGGLVSCSRVAGRLLSACWGPGRLPPGTLGGGGPAGRRDAACQRPAPGGGAAPGGRAAGPAWRRALLGRGGRAGPGAGVYQLRDRAGRLGLAEGGAGVDRAGL